MHIFIFSNGMRRIRYLSRTYWKINVSDAQLAKAKQKIILIFYADLRARTLSSNNNEIHCENNLIAEQ